MNTKYAITLLTLSLPFFYGCDSKETTTDIVNQTDSKTTQQENLPEYYVGIDTTYAPFEFLDENGKPIGYEVDLMNNIAKQANFSVEYFITDRQYAEEDFQNGIRDIWISAFSKSGTEGKPYLRTQPVAQYTLTVALLDDPKNAKIKTLEDLKGKKIAITATSSSSSKDVAREVVGNNGQLIEQSTFPLAIKSIATGETDIVIGNSKVLQYMDQQEPNIKLRYIDINFEPQDIVFLVNPKKPELLDKIDNALTEMKSNGEYNKINRNWFGN